MASDHGKWETVVNKKKGQVSKSDVKKAKEKFLENPSHVKADFKNPLEEGETIYSAAFEKENKKAEDKYPSFHQAESKKGSASPRNVSQKVKKASKPAKPAPLAGIQQKIEKLNGESLSAIVKDVQERFPAHSLVWLKEVASWLQKELSCPAEKDLMLSDQSKGFPECLLTANIRNQLKKLMRKSSDQAIEMLFCFCVTSMLDELKQGKSTIGLRMLVQLLIDRLPNVLITKMDEVLNGKPISQESFLVVIWVYSQQNSDLVAGIQTWWRVMFPVLRVGTHAPHVVTYIEDLLTCHAATKFSSSMITEKQFSDVLNIVFGSKSPLTNLQSLKKRFERLYPIFTRLFFSDKPDQVIVEKFKYLLHIDAVNEPLLQLEVHHLMIFCLSKDPNCFEIWSQNLHKTLKQSGKLWSYIYDHFDSVHKQLFSGKRYKDRTILRRKAEEFFAQLQDIKRKGNGSKAGFAECYQVCQQFQRKRPVVEERRFTMLTLLKYLSIGLLTFTVVDIYRANGFKGSSTESIATKLGVDNHAKAAFVQMENWLGAGCRWSKKNIHPYYAQVHQYLEPTMETGWNHTVRISKAIHEFSKPGLDYASKMTEKVFVKIDEVLPGYVAKVTETTQNIWDSIFPTVQYHANNAATFISEKTPIVISNVSKSINAASNWIYELHPPFFNSALAHATCTMNCMRRYLNDCWDMLVVNAPIVMDAVVENVKWGIEASQGYLVAGQIWFQDFVRSTTGNSATAK